MLENLSWEQITAWAMMIGGPLISFGGAVVVSKLRKKAAEILVRDQQIDAQSVQLISLANKVEVLSQIMSIAFLESKGVSPETKLQLANLAKTVTGNGSKETSTLIENIINQTNAVLQKQKADILKEVKEQSESLITNIKSEISNVDQLI